MDTKATEYNFTTEKTYGSKSSSPTTSEGCMSISLPYVMSDGSVIDAPARIDFSTALPYGIGEPDPITYPQRPDWKVVNGHITAKDVDNAEAAGILPLPVACDPSCSDHDVWYSHIVMVDGQARIVDVPVPDLTANAEADRIDRWEMVPDVLASYATSDASRSLAIEDAGFQYKDQVWVDGIPYGVVELDVDVQDEVLPTFRYQYRGSDVRAVCVCGTHITYSEVARKRGVLVEDPRENMRAFVAMLLLHANALHPDVTREDVCKHGLRRYVESVSRSTGQPFAAKFCSAKKGACDPVWVNDFAPTAAQLAKFARIASR